MNIAIKNKLALLTAAIALLSSPALRAQITTFDVSINTATLNAQDSANAPFYLDFQLNYGGTGSASTVTLSNIQLTGGSSVGLPSTTGTGSGDLIHGVSLTASSSNQLNELYEEFSASTTLIQFRATVSEPATSATPTEFTTAIMDSSLGFPAQLYTTAPDQASLLTLNLAPTDSFSSANVFTSVSSADGNTLINGIAAATAVPEPSTTAMLMGGSVALFAFLARRFRKPQLAA